MAGIVPCGACRPPTPTRHRSAAPSRSSTRASSATYEGFAGYRNWFDETHGPYTDVRWIVESVTPVGEYVVASAITTGRPRGDSTLLEVRLGLLHGIRDGRVSRIGST